MQKQATIRVCDTCNKPLEFKPDGTQVGVYCCDEYFHEGECLDASFENTPETWESHYQDDRNGDCYCTEWELEYTEEAQDD